MLLGHPFDHQDDQTDRERIVAKHFGADRFRRTDHPALDRKASHERLLEALEQMNVLGFLGSEIEDRADAPVVAEQLRARMIHQEGENELLDDAEDRQQMM